MNVGEAARLAQLPVKTLHYYEEIGLIRPHRLENGYRDYDEAQLHKLRFVQRARSLGFSVAQVRALLSLYEDERRASADVKAVAEEHLAEIDRKIEELNSLRQALAGLIEACHGDRRPHCPILDDLAGGQH
jgi:Cu(I)-responsive transcriptional regulator